MSTRLTAWTAALLMLAASPAMAAAAAEADEVAVLRNTVVNILDAMVKQGLISRDAAEKMVADAQQKADAEAQAAGPAAGDVRVTYVPQVVQDDITAKVKQDVQASVVADVKKQAAEEGWGVPAALPDWVRNTRWSGEFRVRGDAIMYADGNQPFTYLNFQEINNAGGIIPAGPDAFLNTTENQMRYLVRLNFGAQYDLSPYATVGFKIGTGNEDNPATRNQALGTYNETFAVLLEEAYLRLGTSPDQSEHQVLFWAGRTPNIYQTTELAWDSDVRFNGFTLQYAWNPMLNPADNARQSRGFFGNLGAYPVEDIALTREDKWLYVGQLGYEFDPVDDLRLSFAVGYFDYKNITGQRNSFDSRQLDYTAPRFLQKGNTLFDIRNDDDPNTQLYALAADYDLLDLSFVGTWTVAPDMVVEVLGQYINNVGFDEGEVEQRTGVAVSPEVNAYRLEFRVGNPKLNRLGAWRAFVAYNYLERDAILDAFSDSEFHQGGTDAEGYIIGGDLGLTRNTSARLRYLSANEIDGPPFGVDILQLDLNAQF